MRVRWTIHSHESFGTRALILGINYGDIELEIKKQSFKIRIEGNKFKTIFMVQKALFTVIKIEIGDRIKILTLWESNQKEQKLWKNRLNAGNAME